MIGSYPTNTLVPMRRTTPFDPAVVETIIDGRPCWLFDDGTVLPVIRGGSDAGTGGGGGEGGEGGDGDEGAGGDDAAAKAAAEKAEADRKAADDAKKKVEYSPEQQAHMAQVIAEERSKAAAAAKKAAEEEITKAAERAKMDEADKAKAEKADAEKAAADATAKANERVIAAEAKVQAVDAGADPKQLAYVLKLADLSDIKVDEATGDPDAKAVRRAIDKVLTDVPALKTSSNGKGASGGQHGGTGDKGRATNLEEAVTARLAS